MRNLGRESERCSVDRMRIAILTFHRAYNCGAMLQAWALKTVLERMGHTVEFPACNEVGYNPPRLMCLNIPAEKKGLQWIRSLIGRIWLDILGHRAGEKRGRAYDSFRKEYLPERNCAPSEFPRYYDLVVIGSDQVFSIRHVAEWRSLFYGEAIPSGLQKIAYAGSIGDVPKSGDDLATFKYDLESFFSVSFREPFEDYPVVADPTLLLSATDYSLLRKRRSVISQRPYVYLYSIYTTDFEVDSAREIAHRLNCELVISPAYPNERTKGLPETAQRLSPEIMVQYIRDAKYVLAGSFHGTALALIHRKPFLTLRNTIQEPMSRPEPLLARLNILERRVDPSVPIEEMIVRLTTEVPRKAYNELEKFSKMSLEWLSGAVGSIAEKMNGCE